MTGLLAAPTPDLATHLAVHGPVPEPADLVAELRAAGLTGRGGGAFPVWRKMAATRAQTAGRILGRAGVVVANGAEGEPLSAKDRTLLARAPHLVLDGLELAAVATGSRWAVAYTAAASVPAVARALAERPAGPVPIEVVTAAEGFVAGEASAVVAALDGRGPVPSDKAVRVSDRGVRARPTAVHNVETLAHVALLARHGTAWFRSRGTPAEPGTMLVTLALPDGTGVREVDLGSPLRPLVGPCAAPVLVGGYHGAWVGPRALETAALSVASLAPLGASPGAGVLYGPGPGRGVLAETARITRFLADARTGQCGPCRHGLPALADAVDALVASRPGARSEATTLAGLVDGRGACHHPDGTARLVRSALRVAGEPT